MENLRIPDGRWDIPISLQQVVWRWRLSYKWLGESYGGKTFRFLWRQCH